MKYYLLFFGLVMSEILVAQNSGGKDLYFRTSGGIGNYYGGKASLEYINKKNQSFIFGMFVQQRITPNLPDDYVSPLGIIEKMIFLGLKLDYPMEVRTTYYLSMGKILRLKNKTTRINLAGGLGLSYLKNPKNFQKIVPNNSFENYSYEYQKSFSLGLVLNPSIDFTGEYLGISAGLNSTITKEKFYYGIEISLLLELMNIKKVFK